MTTVTAQPIEQLIDVRGCQIRVLTAGQGPPLVYLHGAGDLGDWVPALSLLAQDFTVYRPDHPGFNGSDDDPRVDTVLDLAFSYLDLFDQLGLDSVRLVGISLGGWIAAQVAVLAPGQVAKLVLAAPAGLRAEVAVPDVFTLSPVQIAGLTFHRDDLRESAMSAAEGLAADPDMFQRYLRNRMATAHLAWNPYFHDPKLSGRLHRLGAPVLVLWGEHDRVLPAAHARRWADAISDARLEIITGAGHLPHVERPNEFAGLVRTWLLTEDGSC